MKCENCGTEYTGTFCPNCSHVNGTEDFKDIPAPAPIDTPASLEASVSPDMPAPEDFSEAAVTQELTPDSQATPDDYPETPATQEPFYQSETPESPYQESPYQGNPYHTDVPLPACAYQNTNQQQAHTQQTPPKQGHEENLAVIAMILGIASIPAMCFCCLGIPMAIAAIVMGIIVLYKKKPGKNYAIAAIACGGFAIVLGIISLFVLGIAAAMDSSHYY